MLVNLYLLYFYVAKHWPLNTGDCLMIQVASKTGLTFGTAPVLFLRDAPK